MDKGSMVQSARSHLDGIPPAIWHDALPPSKTSPAADDTNTLEIESSDAELREVQAAIKRADAGSIILIRMREGRIVLETGNRSIMSRPGAILICFAGHTYGVTRVECISFGEERCLLALTLTERLIRRQLIDSPEAVEHNTLLIEGPRAIRDAIKLHAEKGSADELLFVYVDDNGEYIVGWETKTRLELEASLDRDG
jgi:hypothetical protein